MSNGFNSMAEASMNSNLSIDDNKTRMIRKLDEILKKYKIEDLQFDRRLVRILNQLKRRRKEFNATRFFVLVVGPVKSGKSTLVNIFARNYVSPTAYKECTALPTIIGKSDGEHLNKIVQYVPTLDYNEDESKITTFDYIIDVIRGVEDNSILDKRIYKKVSALTPENVKDIVTLYYDEAVKQDDLVVSIGIEGKGFIDDEIMLIDMPGLDGGQKHKDNTLVYSNMAQRADVVFFVQSTTSAINKDSIDFLNELFNDKKGKVPIWLIHNLHEAQYFLNDDTKKKDDIDEQIAIGRKRVEEGFGIKKFKHIVLNLGKIYAHINEHDRIKDDFIEDIKDKFSEYEKIEKDLIETLKSERQAIKDENNIGKATDEIEESLRVINKIIKEKEKEIKDLKQEIAKINDLHNNLNGTGLYEAVFRETYQGLLQTHHIAESWKECIKSIIDDNVRIEDIRYTYDEAINHIDRILDLALVSIPIGESSMFRMDLCRALIEQIENHFGNAVREIEQQLTDALRTNIRLAPDINELISEKLSLRPNRFPSFPISRTYWGGLRIFEHRLTKQEYNQYLNDVGRHMINKIPQKIEEYGNIITVNFRTIRDEYINKMKQSIETYAKEYEKLQNGNINRLEEEIKIIDNLKNDLS